MNHFEKLESYVPFDLLIPQNFVVAVLLVTSVVLFRYFTTTFMFYAIFYRRRWKWSNRRQIYPELPPKDIQLYEMKWSAVSSIIFGVAGVLMGVFWQLGWSKMYLRMDKYGWTYFILSGFIVSVLHDFYFYVTHRWLHHPWAYKRFHAVHHASLHPSPWASFSFHPVESVIEAIPLPLITLLIPLHPIVIIAYLTIATVSAIINHLGFEVMPKGAAQHPLGKWLISGTHHAGHHRFYKYNFGLFYTFWDHLLGTQYPGYEKQFQQNTEVKLES